jgi:hypothetical protein
MTGRLDFPFSSQVQTLGPTSYGTVAREWSKEISFPRRMKTIISDI